MQQQQLELLIAEDDINNFLLFKKHLRHWGMSVPITHFISGREVLGILFAARDMKCLDKKRYVLLLDIDMPDMDGLDVLRRIKEDPALAVIPVVVHSADEDPATIKRCYEMGCDAYFAKPIKRQDIIELLDRYTCEPLISIPDIYEDTELAESVQPA